MKTIKLLSLSIAALLFAACSNEDDLGNNNPVISSKGESTVTLKLANGSGIRTAEIGTAEENALTRLEFYVFDAAGAADGITGYFLATGDEVKRTTKIQINSGDNVKFVVVANAPVAIGPQATYAALDEMLAAGEFKTLFSPTEVPATGLEMVGIATANITAAAENAVTVPIDRLVSRFDQPAFASTGLLELSDYDLEELWGLGTTVTNDDVTFTFDGYALVNGINKSNLIENWPSSWDGAAWTAWSANKTYLNSTFDATGKYTDNYSGTAADEWFIKDIPVYAYENAPNEATSLAGSGYDPKTVYAFIIKGDLEAGSVTKTRYWRVNIDKEAYYKISRNNWYKVTVNTIKTIGYETPEEAETTNPIIPSPDDTYVDITVVVNPWNVVEIEGQM